MRYIFALLLFLGLFGCGGGANRSGTTLPEGADLRVDMIVPVHGQVKSVELSFYYQKPPQQVDGKLQPAIEVIRVDEASFNGTPLAEANNESGRLIYRHNSPPFQPLNTVTAKVDGKTFEAKMQRIVAEGSQSTSAVMYKK